MASLAVSDQLKKVLKDNGKGSHARTSNTSINKTKRQSKREENTSKSAFQEDGNNWDDDE